MCSRWARKHDVNSYHKNSLSSASNVERRHHQGKRAFTINLENVTQDRGAQDAEINGQSAPSLLAFELSVRAPLFSLSTDKVVGRHNHAWWLITLLMPI
jgi:hypothetical protein